MSPESDQVTGKDELSEGAKNMPTMEKMIRPLAAENAVIRSLMGPDFAN